MVEWSHDLQSTLERVFMIETGTRNTDQGRDTLKIDHVFLSR